MIDFTKYAAYAPIARIILRYVSGGGVVAGVLGAEFIVDPDIILIVSFTIGAAVEGLYTLAKMYGGET